MGAVASTRERLLKSALNSFAQRGYEATSLDALAEHLGVRKQTILYYHRTKEDLLAAVIEQAASDLAEVLVESLKERHSDIAAVVDAVLRMGAERPELLALVREAVRLGPPASALMLAALHPLLERATAAVPEQRVLMVAAMVVGMATEVEVLRAAGTEPDIGWLRRRRRAVLAELG